jgi:hypothetical protein
MRDDNVHLIQNLAQPFVQMTSKSGRYKLGARAVARSVKQDKHKLEKQMQEDKRAAEAVEKSAQEKRSVEKNVAEAVEAEKIMDELWRQRRLEDLYSINKYNKNGNNYNNNIKHNIKLKNNNNDDDNAKAGNQ